MGSSRLNMLRLIAGVLITVLVYAECRPSSEGTVVSCPEDVHDFILPHETDCSKFYKCSWGEPHLYQCPEGLWFDPTKDVCNWPDEVDCTNGGDNGGDSGDSGEGSGGSSESSSESESSEESSSSESDSSSEEDATNGGTEDSDEGTEDSNEAAEEEFEKLELNLQF